MYNLDEMDKFLEKLKLTKEKKIENVNRSVTSEESEVVI